MKWYSIERNDSTRDLLLADEEIVKQTQSMGLSCSRTRQVFEEYYGKEGPVFNLISNNGISLVDSIEEISDMSIWSWIPVFSSRAKESFSALVESDDFLPCVVLGAKQRDCFIHLPNKPANGLLVGQSRFKSFVPMSPPIPLGAVELTVDPLTTWGDNMFRVAVPSTGQLLSELLVTDRICTEWHRRGFTGASFREIPVHGGLLHP